MSHDEASDLLGAYALDAVDGDEFTELEAHLETCPRCRAELDSLREVAAAMGNSVEPPPEGLWSQIALRLPERQEDDEPPPMPRLTLRGPLAVPHARSPAPTRRRRVMVTAIGAIAVAAAAVAVVLGIGLVRADNKVSNLQASGSGVVRGGGRAPHARAPGGHARLEHARGGRPQVVVLPSGQGYLVSSTLPALGQGPDLPAVGDRGESADLPGPAGPLAEPGRLHHGRIDAPLAPEHHGRAGGRVRRSPPARSSPPGLSDAGRSC